MKNIWIALMVAALALLTGCSSEEPSVVCGRDWNAGAMVVADTTSEFELADPMVVQFRYGRNFDFSKLKVAFYDGTLANRGEEIWSREISVNGKADVYTLQGKSKHGGMMLAREMCKKRKPGPILIEFSSEEKVIVAKEINLTKTR